MEEHGPDYRTVAVYWTLAEAELARGVLEAEGIPAAFVDAVDAALLPGARAVRLLVPARDMDRSRDLLRGGDDMSRTDDTAALESGARAFPAWCVTAIVLAVGFAALVALALRPP